MSTTLTTFLSLIKSAFNTEKDTWGANINTSFDLIDTFAAKVPVLLSTGVVASVGDMNITGISTAYRRYQLVLYNVSSNAAVDLFLRFDLGAGYLTTGYDYSRADLSAKSSGTQTLAGATNAAAIILSDTVTATGNANDQNGTFTIDILVRPNVSGSVVNLTVESVGTYRNADGGGYRTTSRGSGALIGQTAMTSLAIKIGGRLVADYTNGFRGSYALYGVPGPVGI